MYCILLDGQISTLSIDMINNKFGRGMIMILCHQMKIAHFVHIFFKHGYLIIAIRLKTIPIAETHVFYGM